MFFNQIKTAFFLALLSGLFLILGAFLGGNNGLIVAGIFALIMNGISYFYSDSIVLRMYNAKPLDQNRYADIYQMIRELTERSGLPMPRLWLINTPIANAFATGRNPKHASIALTTSIIDILSPEELRGVLAHEISHIANRDILIGSIAATVATALGFLANMLQHKALFYDSQRSNAQRGPHPLVTLIVALTMPIIATIIQAAISRSREYMADETGAHTCKDPLALASALEKLNNHTKTAHFSNTDTAHAASAHLFIVNPFLPKGLIQLFSTHPPMADRINRLRQI